jgi:predicted nucleic acid-binding protein
MTSRGASVRTRVAQRRDAGAKWVVDASVAAKWLAPEPDSPSAEALLDDELFVPDLLFAEVGNILWKKQQRGEMDAGATQVGARWLLQVPLQVHESASLLTDALALALRLQHPAYDCFYLALALRIDVPLATADRRLHARCHAVDAAAFGKWVKLLDPA